MYFGLLFIFYLRGAPYFGAGKSSVAQVQKFF